MICIWNYLTWYRNREGLNDWIYAQAHPNEDSSKT